MPSVSGGRFGRHPTRHTFHPESVSAELFVADIGTGQQHFSRRLFIACSSLEPQTDVVVRSAASAAIDPE